METQAQNVTEQQKAGMLRAVRAVADAVHDLGSVPSGHLYSQVMGAMSLETYEGILSVLVGAKLVSRRNHMLTWTGPRRAA